MLFLRELIIKFNMLTIFYMLSINTFYFIQLILAAFRLSSYVKKMRYSDFKKYITSQNMIPISILVPAYNEQNTITSNIKALFSLNYPEYEIIVINDGSQDNTLQKIIDEFKLKPVNQPFKYTLKTKEIKNIYRNPEMPNLILVDKENGGKSDALNAGVNISNYPVYAAIDADSILESDSLIRLIMPFLENPDTVAVGGIVRIANGTVIRDGKLEDIKLPQNSVAMFQVVEYLRAFLSGRMGWDAMNMLLIISGAFGAFRKSRVVELGGYKTGTIGEDMELVVRLHRYMRKNRTKYSIKFIPDPVCWTVAPENLKDLRGQRRRWQIGLMDSLLKHKVMFLNPAYGMIGIFAMPCFVVFELFGPVIELLGYILVPLSFLFDILNIRFFALFLAASILYGIVLSLGAVILEEYTFSKYPSLSHMFKLTAYGIFDNFGYRQLNMLYRVEGIILFKRMKNHWGSIRKRSFENISSTPGQVEKGNVNAF